ncbi:lipopolysaccharide-modifying protein [Maritalea mobilis]|uniref:glycosyl transferase family 90 n=1 Tax=Maritalea mobilis TaxID=483324 RepID=UPI001C96BFB8|nr:glycosyl transferase family 90 [Maritalea mobilis]MBY6200994.1 lipopolysaccharide-modifying protein [Maritalea mobilis]
MDTAQKLSLIEERMSERIRSLGFAPLRLRAVSDPTIPCWQEMHLHWDGDTIVVAARPDKVEGYTERIYERGGAHVYWFSLAGREVRHAVCDLSDGEDPGFARFSYCTCFSGIVPVPDYYFFNAAGYHAAHLVGQAAPSWDERRDEIIWRGQSNGLGLLSVDPAHVDNPGVVQRLRMAMKCRDIAGVDFRFVDTPGLRFRSQLKAAGLLGERIVRTQWAGRKYALDVDGNTNSWDNMLERMKMGCCVLKVASPFGFRQWFSHRLEPGRHFVPVAADMSDLEEKIDWVRSNPTEARAIAEEGQALARTITFDSEAEVAAELFRMHWQ